MAKYRITSIPQARYGGVFNKSTKITKSRNDVSEEPQEAMVEVQNVEQPSYWNQMQSPVMQGKQCPPGKYDYNGECLTESEMRAAWAEEQKDWESQMSDRKLAHEQKMQESRQRLYDTLVDQEAQFRELKWKEYNDTYKNSKKSDKVEPFDRIPLTKFNKEHEDQFKQAGFLVNKNNETGFAEVYPMELAYDKIINNGFQADQFKNYWGLDPKQVKEQLGPIMDAAKEQYDATVKQKIIDKAIKENKPLSKVIDSLPSSLGTKEGLKGFEKPAQKQIDNALKVITENINQGQIDNDKLIKDESVFFSNDPQTAWEQRYHKNDLNYESQKFDRGQKAFDDWMTKYNVSNPDIKYSQDDQMANQRVANDLAKQNVNLSAATNKRKAAENLDFTNALGEYFANYNLPVQQEVLTKAIGSLNQKDKIKFLHDVDAYPDKAFQWLLEKKVPNSKQSYMDLLGEKAGNSVMAGMIAHQDQMKQGFSKEDPTTGDKVLDVLKHPFDATYFAMNPRETMWDNKSGTYRQRVKDEDKLGVNLGTMPDYSPMWAMNQAVNVFNPFKIGMNLREGYDEGDFVGALGKELWDVGTAYGGMRGLGAVSKIGQKLPVNALQAGSRAAFSRAGLKNAFTSGAKNLLKNTGTIASNTLSNPFVDASVLMSLDQNVENAKDAFNKGDYKTAAMEAGIVGLSALPAYNFAKGLRKVPNLDYYNFNQTVQPTQNILDSKKLLGYKAGGMVMKLSKKEIDQYIKEGYIIEDE
jgi:hypothetical protein